MRNVTDFAYCLPEFNEILNPEPQIPQAHNVTDFAYGQPEFNEMLDTANVKKAASLHQKHNQRHQGGGLVPGVRSQVPEAESHEEEELTGDPPHRADSLS